MGAFAIAAALAVSFWGWVVFDAFRNGRRWEAVGWIAFLALVAGVLLAARAGQPRWVTNVLVSVSFLIWAPLTWNNFRRRWQAFTDALPPGRS